jgi:demethylmenaquinone methyltransferase / 2-methoxy-6-polyprenyl-1,4-benzoquinol methylase
VTTRFDVLSFTYLLRCVDDCAATMRELARAVRPGGPIAMVEAGVPPAAPVRAPWRVHTRIGLPVLGRLVSPPWLEVGRFSRAEHRGVPRRRTGSDRPLGGDGGIGEVRLRRMSFEAGKRDARRAEWRPSAVASTVPLSTRS